MSAAGEADDAVLQQQRDQIIDAVLPHVAFEGWTDRALRAGAADLGISIAEVRLAFPDGVPEMVRHWSASADQRMLTRLQQEELEVLGIRERIARAVRVRIAQDTPHREAVRRTLGFLALPMHQALAARCTYSTIDAIWYACGDTATDIGYYTKRATLSAVYIATLLHWLADTSEDASETWLFLDRRIADVMRLPRLMQGVRAALMPFSPASWFRPH